MWTAGEAGRPNTGRWKLLGLGSGTATRTTWAQGPAEWKDKWSSRCQRKELPEPEEEHCKVCDHHQAPYNPCPEGGVWVRRPRCSGWSFVGRPLAGAEEGRRVVWWGDGPGHGLLPPPRHPPSPDYRDARGALQDHPREHGLEAQGLPGQPPLDRIQQQHPLPVAANNRWRSSVGGVVNPSRKQQAEYKSRK